MKKAVPDWRNCRKRIWPFYTKATIGKTWWKPGPANSSASTLLYLLYCIYSIALYLLYCIIFTHLIYCKLLCIYSIVLFCVYCIVLCLWYKSSHPSLWSKNFNISKLFTHNTSVSLKKLFWLWNCTSIALITRNKCRE